MIKKMELRKKIQKKSILFSSPAVSPPQGIVFTRVWESLVTLSQDQQKNSEKIKTTRDEKKNLLP
jgi:hypothetical protein